MVPLWRIVSGTFAGWRSENGLFDTRGRYIGFFVGDVAYSPVGKYLGEIHGAEWIGRRVGTFAVARPPQGLPASVPTDSPRGDRPGLGESGWDEPAF
jgi:hypothetical protein